MRKTLLIISLVAAMAMGANAQNDQRRTEFIHPGRDLRCSGFRIERIGPYADADIVHAFLQEAGYPAVAPAAHPVYV